MLHFFVNHLRSAILLLAATGVAHGADIFTFPSDRLQQNAVGEYRVDFNDEIFDLSPGQEASLTIPDLGDFQITHERTLSHLSGNRTWIGRLKLDTEVKRVFITSNGTHIDGIIQTPSGNVKLLTRFGDGFLIDRKAQGMQKMPYGQNDGIAPPDIPSAKTSNNAPTTLKSAAATTIDIMVLYNQTFFDERGGVPSVRINNLVAIANQAYSDSLVDQQIRVVHTQLINYANSPSNNTLLNALVGNSISGINVPNLRTTYGADIAVVIRPYERPIHGGCGLAYVLDPGSSRSYALGTVSDGSDLGGSNYYCDNYTFAHEVGHIMGNAHDRANAKVVGAYDYSYGYGTNDTFGTIMSYTIPALAVFSNPDINLCNGGACGLPVSNSNSAHNALSMTNMKAQTAAYYSTVIPENPDCDTSPVTIAAGNYFDQPAICSTASVTSNNPANISVSAAGDLTIQAPAISLYNTFSVADTGTLLLTTDTSPLAADEAVKSSSSSNIEFNNDWQATYFEISTDNQFSLSLQRNSKTQACWLTLRNVQDEQQLLPCPIAQSALNPTFTADNQIVWLQKINGEKQPVLHQKNPWL